MHKCLGKKNLGHCILISKYPHTLSDADYEGIYGIWFSTKETKSESQKVAAYVKDSWA